MGSEEVEKEKSSGKQLCKTIVQVAFSQIGLCVLVVLYCVLGGFLFELLEKENEIQACKDARKEYLDMENETLFSLLDVVLSNPLNSEAADAQLNGVFESFRNNSISIGYDGSWCEGYGLEDGPVHEWTLPGGVFFSMTVITTIGYGHIAPKTIWGRILCISYAMLGIPLMLLFLANIGDILAEIFRYIYARIICCGCMKKRKQKSQLKGQTNPAATCDNEVQGQQGPKTNSGKEPRTLSRCPTVLSREPTAIQAREADGTEVKQRLPMVHSSSSIKTLDSNEVKERGRLARMSSGKEPLLLDYDSDDDDNEDEAWEALNKVSVPLTVSMGIIGLYIALGAVLFKYWEGWDLLQSSYFCFITLSTIGFGDVTPGRDFTDPMANARLIIGTVYSLFGMAILSMCFTLMQEEMTAKFRWIGQKMGVVEDEFDDLEDSHSLDLAYHNRNQSEC